MYLSKFNQHFKQCNVKEEAKVLFQVQLVESHRDIEKPADSQQSVHLRVVSAQEQHCNVTANKCLLIAMFSIL